MTPDLITGASLDQQAASAAVRTHCRWHIAPVITETVVVEGEWQAALFVPTMLLRSVVSVVNVNTGGTLTTDDYVITPWGGVVSTGGTFAGRYSITFTHGYDSVPPEVERVVDTLVSAGTYAIDKYETAALANFRLPGLR